MSPMSASWALTGPKWPIPRDEGEEQVLGDEAPGEEADDGSYLVAENGAEADADPAPEGGAGHGAQEEQSRLRVVEREVDAAAGEARVTDTEAECRTGDSEDDPGEHARSNFGAQHARP